MAGLRVILMVSMMAMVVALLLLVAPGSGPGEARPIPDHFDCGPLGSLKYRCGDLPPAAEQASSQEEEAAVDAFPERSDCGPLVSH